MNRMVLAIMFAAGLSAPAFAGNCADLGRGMRFCDQSGATGQTTSRSGASAGTQGQTTNSQNNAGSNQTTR